MKTTHSMVMCIYENGKEIIGKPCSNSKFMHIAGLPGVIVKTSYDHHHNEETTVIYKDGLTVAERIRECVHFPGSKPSSYCFLFDIEGIEIVAA